MAGIYIDIFSNNSIMLHSTLIIEEQRHHEFFKNNTGYFRNNQENQRQLWFRERWDSKICKREFSDGIRWKMGGNSIKDDSVQNERRYRFISIDWGEESKDTKKQIRKEVQKIKYFEQKQEGGFKNSDPSKEAGQGQKTDSGRKATE